MVLIWQLLGKNPSLWSYSVLTRLAYLALSCIKGDWWVKKQILGNYGFTHIFLRISSWSFANFARNHQNISSVNRKKMRFSQVTKYKGFSFAKLA